jgi:K+/H+ antiporter YhaU regulatory subunit KhtT
MNDKENIVVAKNIGKQKLEVVYLSSAITRIIAQTCLQTGLSHVYNELLEFSGNEIYFYKNNDLVGTKFSDVILKFSMSTVIGIFRQGNTIIRPEFTLEIEKDDELILIAEDEDKIEFSNEKINVHKDLIVNKEHQSSSKIEFISMIGFNPKTIAVLKEFNNYLIKGSRMKILVNSEDSAEEIRNVDSVLDNIETAIEVGETHSRKKLENFIDDECNHVIIFANENLSVGEKDSQTLLTLLHLRDIEEKRGKNLEIISEITDVKNSDIIDLAKSDDFIISELLACKMMTQISENRNLISIFEDLLSTEGSEIYLKPVENYVKLGTEVDFYALSVSAVEKGEIAIGYKIKQTAHLPKVVINPCESDKIVFNQGDMIVVISED